MGKCDNCGNSGIFLHTFNCRICDKQMCEKCRIFLFRLLSSGIWKNEFLWDACSTKCVEKFANEVIDKLSSDQIGIKRYEDVQDSPFPQLIVNAVANPDKNWCEEKVVQLAEKGKHFIVDFMKEPNSLPITPIIRSQLWDYLDRAAELIRAEHLLKAGRHEEAAQIYEQHKMYEDAGKARGRGREIVMKGRQVSVDLNLLLSQIRDGGLIMAYRCPNCNGKIKIDSEATSETLEHCSYCGEIIKTIDLISYLKSAL